MKTARRILCMLIALAISGLSCGTFAEAPDASDMTVLSAEAQTPSTENAAQPMKAENVKTATDKAETAKTENVKTATVKAETDKAEDAKAEQPARAESAEGADKEAVEETVKDAAEETVEETVEETAKETAESAAEETVEETVEETDEETVQDAAEETVEETVEEETEETADEPAEEPAEEAEDAPITEDEPITDEPIIIEETQDETAQDDGELLDTEDAELEERAYLKVTFSSSSAIYDGTDKTPAVTVRIGDTVFGSGDYALYWTVRGFDDRQGDLIEPEDYIAHVSCKDPASGEILHAEEMFTVYSRELRASDIHLSPDSAVYTGAEQELCYDFGTLPTENICLMGIYDANGNAVSCLVNAGTYTLRFAGRNNCEGTVDMTYTIRPATLTADNARLSATRFVFNNQMQVPKVLPAEGHAAGEFYIEGYLDAHHRMCEDYDCVEPGKYTVVIEGMGNYEGTVELSFDICRYALTEGDITLSADSMFYTGLDEKPTVLSEGLVEDRDYTVQYDGGKWTDAGIYSLTVVGIGDYCGTVTRTFRIEAMPMYAAALELVSDFTYYTGSAADPIVCVPCGVEGKDYTVSYTNKATGAAVAHCKDAGTYGVLVEAVEGGNFTGSDTLTYMILPNTLMQDMISLKSASAVYNGKAQDPEFTTTGALTAKDIKIDERTDEKGNIVAECINAGTYCVTVRGKNNYTGTVSFTYVIKPAKLPASGVYLEQTYGIYDGKAKMPEAANGKGVAVEDFYVVKYLNAAGEQVEGCTELGVYTVVVGGTRNYTGTVELKYTVVTGIVEAANVSLSKTKVTYNGKDQKPTVKVKGMTEGKDFAVTYKKGNTVVTECKDAGTYTVIVTGIGTCGGTASKQFKINQLDVSKVNISLAASSAVYNGRAQNPVIRGLNKGEYKVSYYFLAWSGYGVITDSCVEARNYNVIIEGVGNYKGATARNYTIKNKTLTEQDVTLSSDTVTYNGKAQKCKVTIKGLTEGKDYTVAYTQNGAAVDGCKDAGTYTVTVTGIGWCTGAVSRTFTVTPKELTKANVRLASSEGSYTGLTHYVTPLIDAGEVAEEDFEVTHCRRASDGAAVYMIEVGKYIVTVQGTHNYTGSVELSYEITRRPLEEEWVSVSAAEAVYDGAAHTPEVSVFRRTEGTDYTITYTSDGREVSRDFVDAGSYRIAINGIGNYTGTIYRDFTVRKRQISDVGVALLPAYATFDGTEKEPVVIVETLVKDTDYRVEYLRGASAATDFVHAGTYTVRVTGMGNYEGTVDTEYRIGQLYVSESEIYLSSKSAVYDGTDKMPDAIIDNVHGNCNELLRHTDASGIGCSAFIDAGTYYISVDNSGDLCGGARKTFVIEPKALTESDVYVVFSETAWNGMIQNPIVAANGKLTEADYTVSYRSESGALADNCVDAGRYTVIVEGRGNYKGTVELSYTIGTPSFMNVFTNTPYVTFDGTAHEGELFVTNASGDILAENVDYTLAYDGDTTNVTGDDVVVTVTGTGAYTGGSAQTSFRIEPMDVSDSAYCNYSPEHYGMDIKPVVSIPGLAEYEDYTLIYGIPVVGDEDARTATVTLVNSNYTFCGENEKTFVYRINPLNVFGETSLSPEFERYSGKAQRPALSIEGLTEGTDYTVTYRNAAGEPIDEIVEVGDYTVLVTLTNEQYIFHSDNGDSHTTAKAFKILPLELFEEYVSVKNAVYDGKAHDGDLTVTVNGQLLAEGVDYVADYAGDRVNVTEAGVTVTVTGIGSYEGTVTATYYITAAEESKERTAMRPAMKVSPMAGMTELWGYAQRGASLTVRVNGKKLSAGNLTVTEDGFFRAKLSEALCEGDRIVLTVTDADGDTAAARYTAGEAAAQHATANALGTCIAGTSGGKYKAAYVTPVEIAGEAVTLPILAFDVIPVGTVTYAPNGDGISVSYEIADNAALPEGAKAYIGVFAAEPTIGDIENGGLNAIDARTSGAFDDVDVTGCGDTAWIYVGVDVELSAEEIAQPSAIYDPTGENGYTDFN